MVVVYIVQAVESSTHNSVNLRIERDSGCSLHSAGGRELHSQQCESTYRKRVVVVYIVQAVEGSTHNSVNLRIERDSGCSLHKEIHSYNTPNKNILSLPKVKRIWVKQRSNYQAVKNGIT